MSARRTEKQGLEKKVTNGDEKAFFGVLRTDDIREAPHTAGVTCIISEMSGNCGLNGSAVRQTLTILGKRIFTFVMRKSPSRNLWSFGVVF